MENCFAHCKVKRVKCQLIIDSEPDKKYVMPFKNQKSMHDWLSNHPQYSVLQLLLVYEYDC